MSQKIKLDLNVPLLNVEGKPFEDTNMAKFIAGRLYSANEGDALKFLDWSMTLFSGGVLEVDESDYNSILTCMKNTPNISRGILGQIMRVFSAAKD